MSRILQWPQLLALGLDIILCDFSTADFKVFSTLDYSESLFQQHGILHCLCDHSHLPFSPLHSSFPMESACHNIQGLNVLSLFKSIPCFRPCLPSFVIRIPQATLVILGTFSSEIFLCWPLYNFCSSMAYLAILFLLTLQSRSLNSLLHYFLGLCYSEWGPWASSMRFRDLESWALSQTNWSRITAVRPMKTEGTCTLSLLWKARQTLRWLVGSRKFRHIKRWQTLGMPYLGGQTSEMYGQKTMILIVLFRYPALST